MFRQKHKMKSCHFKAMLWLRTVIGKVPPGHFFLASEGVGGTNPCSDAISIVPQILHESCKDLASGSSLEENSKARAMARSSSARTAALLRAGISYCRGWSCPQLPSTSRMIYLDGSVLISLHIIHGGFQTSDINSFLSLWHFNPMRNFLPSWVLSKTHKLMCVST